MASLQWHSSEVRIGPSATASFKLRSITILLGLRRDARFERPKTAGVSQPASEAAGPRQPNDIHDAALHVRFAASGTLFNQVKLDQLVYVTYRLVVEYGAFSTLLSFTGKCTIPPHRLIS